MWKNSTIYTRCAREHVRTGNFEMLKITWFVLKKNVNKWFWAILNFDVRARHDSHADMND